MRRLQLAAKQLLCLALLVGSATAMALPSVLVQALDNAGIPARDAAFLVEPVQPPVRGATASVPAHAGKQPAVAIRGTPQARLAWQADLPLNPASVMKVVTTSAALDLLGPSYFWKTRVYAQGPIRDGVLQGDLLIQGSGDPKLVHERLTKLLEGVRGRGIARIAGDILLDNSVFQLPAHDPAAFDGEPLRPYNVGPDGLLVNFNAVAFHFRPAPGSGRAQIESEPLLAGVRLPTQVAATSGACGNWRLRLGADFSNPTAIHFGGRYPAGCGEREWSVAYPMPEEFAPRVVAALWQELGGTLDGRVRWQSPTRPGRAVATGFSLPLSEIVADINQYSNNVMAQQLFLTLSAQGGPGSFGASRQRVQRWWEQNFSPLAVPLMDNGSGLSRSARASARALAAVLQHNATGKYNEFFRRSLPIAGVNGTAQPMVRRSPDSPAIGRALLKTGSLRDVSAIAGYVLADSGQQYVVVGILNHARAPGARAVLDRLVEWAIQDEAPQQPITTAATTME